MAGRGTKEQDEISGAHSRHEEPGRRAYDPFAFVRGFETAYDWSRRDAYSLDAYFALLDQVVERYFYGFHLPIGKRLLDGKFTPSELRFLAAQEYHYYASTTWWNAGKLLNSDTLEQQRLLHAPLLDELGEDLVRSAGLPAHAALFLEYCEGLGLDLDGVLRTPVVPGVVLAVTELRRLAATRPSHEFIAASNLVVERMRPRHYHELLRSFETHYTWVPKRALKFYEVHAHLDTDHESLGRRLVTQYVRDRREQDLVFAAVLRSLSLRIAMYQGINEALAQPGGVGLVVWPNFPREPWPRPTPLEPRSGVERKN